MEYNTNVPPLDGTGAECLSKLVQHKVTEEDVDDVDPIYSNDGKIVRECACNASADDSNASNENTDSNDYSENITIEVSNRSNEVSLLGIDSDNGTSNNDNSVASARCYRINRLRDYSRHFPKIPN